MFVSHVYNTSQCEAWISQAIVECKLAVLKNILITNTHHLVAAEAVWYY